ncbi:hypothetical protein JYU34_001768 [Plutella xylostella]|uniref:Uncharacterized protein n=1 Tax=Plutella xylostella TaxID=51655 RepID=A0ABQ7R4R0_PLUXY|nr:hypothetical protein JYU34_001768 [Plutella xylostella]
MPPSILHLLLLFVFHVQGQRPGFAGSRPIGYPELYDRPTTPRDELGNRFGDGNATTQNLPLEAKGDKDLVDRLSKLPVDQQPFWLINWQALEEQRKKPQTYPLRPNPFVEGNTETHGKNKNLKTTEEHNKHQSIPNTNDQAQESIKLKIETDSMDHEEQNSERRTRESNNDSKKPNKEINTKSLKINDKVSALLLSG